MVGFWFTPAPPKSKTTTSALVRFPGSTSAVAGVAKANAVIAVPIKKNLMREGVFMLRIFSGSEIQGSSQFVNRNFDERT
jgi:hypothetical protein